MHRLSFLLLLFDLPLKPLGPLVARHGWTAFTAHSTHCTDEYGAQPRHIRLRDLIGRRYALLRT